MTVTHYFILKTVIKALISSRASFPILLYFFNIILDIHSFETAGSVLTEVVSSL